MLTGYFKGNSTTRYCPCLRVGRLLLRRLDRAEVRNTNHQSYPSIISVRRVVCRDEFNGCFIRRPVKTIFVKWTLTFNDKYWDIKRSAPAVPIYIHNNRVAEIREYKGMRQTARNPVQFDLRADTTYRKVNLNRNSNCVEIFTPLVTVLEQQKASKRSMMISQVQIQQNKIGIPPIYDSTLTCLFLLLRLFFSDIPPAFDIPVEHSSSVDLHNGDLFSQKF